MKSEVPVSRINWVTSGYLIVTGILSMTVVPVCLWRNGIDWFQASLFVFFVMATGLSITLGYHRLFSHLCFVAKWPVKAFILFFGCCSFQNSALQWSSEHRKHHKHVDHEGDPYDITKGFWHAHVGWLFTKLHPELPMDNVADLRKDSFVMWQHRNYLWIAIGGGFLLPAAIGFLYGGVEGAISSFLIAGVLRVTCVQHATFCINSFCHIIGKQPYSTACTARDSWIMALFTFGEGYHNFHHEFQHDYRNGVKLWQYDPTKWAIALLEKIGLVSDLRRVPEERILLVEMAELHKRIKSGLRQREPLHLPEATRLAFEHSTEYLQQFSLELADGCRELQHVIKGKLEYSSDRITEWRREVKIAMMHLERVHDTLFSFQPV